jgi:short-subunit dehydrogenase
MPQKYFTLITGASEGFGRALAIECARRCMHLILVALPDHKLNALAHLIMQQYGVDVVCIEKDLCEQNSCQEIYNEISAARLQVNILINNAGVGSTGFFEEGSLHAYERLIHLNILATTLLTRLFLGMLKGNSPSYILNVGSLAAYFPIPKKHVYGASKSYILYFSKCLRKELKKDGVHVSVICPGPMNTNSDVQAVIQSGNFLIRNSSFEPEKLAAPVITQLLHKKAVMLPGRLNKLYILVFTLLPDFVRTIITIRSTKKLASAGNEVSTMPKKPVLKEIKTGKAPALESAMTHKM